jgi:lipoprotein-anchoring transpeptidase ErfK/SrfK
MARQPAHRRRSSRRIVLPLLAGILLAIAAVAVLASGALGGQSGPSNSQRLGTSTHPSAPAHASAASGPATPLVVEGTSPPGGGTGVDPGAPITVNLSAPLSTTSPMPLFNPPLSGTWQALTPTVLQFVASAPLVPGTSETLIVPGGPGGLVSNKGALLSDSVSAAFTVAPGSELRLQQLLAQLGYMPLNFVPTGAAPSPQQQADPQEGGFAWKWANLPTNLTGLWNAGSDNVITKGAVMRFEDQNKMETDGVAGTHVWSALLQAAVNDTTDPSPYGFVLVNQTLPQSATVFQNGTAAYTTPVNTGISAAPTDDGTFPVYLRYDVTTMSGTNPDGSKYEDPGIPWVSYFNGGDALHGFVRGGYGYPQSLGCVEMPISNAAVVYPMTPIGTLVTVIN